MRSRRRGILEAVLDSLPADLRSGSSALQHGSPPEHRGFPWLPSAFCLKLSSPRVRPLVRIWRPPAFKRLLLFNAHGGQIALAEVAARQ